MKPDLYGFMNCLLRVDLTQGVVTREPLKAVALRSHVGGAGLAAQYLYDEVPPGVAWDNPANRLILMTGPLSGTLVPGGGTFEVMSKGPMTNLAVSSQANGVFGAYVKRSGLDGIVLQGRAGKLSYLVIDDDRVEIKDAAHLKGLDTWETEEVLKKELGSPKAWSVCCIGPSGENLVRFAAIFCDLGHVASKNGLGAVMGSKNLKAVAVRLGKHQVPVADPAKLKELVPLIKKQSEESNGGRLLRHGTAAHLGGLYKTGTLPIKNYTTNLWPAYEQFTGQAIRERFAHKLKPCWACTLHTRWMTVPDGPYQGVYEEPDLENITACGPVIDNTDPAAMIYLTNLVDRLGFDMNETGWLLGLVMECYEAGLLKKEDLGGLELNWGNVAAAAALLKMIAKREGIGDILAEGVKGAGERLGPEVAARGVYVLKGSTPRGHDHRGRWDEMLDTCLGNTSTIEASGGDVNIPEIGVKAPENRHSPNDVADWNSAKNGRRQFEDCVGLCRYSCVSLTTTVETVNAVTGWDMGVEEALNAGRRCVHLLRAFNFRHGLDIAGEWPSPRYGSAPTDGPTLGTHIVPVFAEMRTRYWRGMGWDENNGRPLPATLKRLGQEELIPAFWP